jgi:hypothetical protein
MTGARKTTILDAVVEVLRSETQSATPQEIHDRIITRKLFEFRAKDPVAMVRAAIRKHLRTAGAAGGGRARVVQMNKDRYKIA